MTGDAGEHRRLNALQHSVGSLTRRIRLAGKAAGKVAGRARASAPGVSAAAVNVPTALHDVIEAAIEQVRAVPDRVSHLVLREARVPVFLLPTGSGPGDFYCAFQFDQMLADLRSGVLVRPVMDVWTGRHDFDQEHLADVLKEEFTRQLKATKERNRQAIDAEVASLVANIEPKRQRAAQSATGAMQMVTIALIGMLLATGIGDLILLGIALFGGRRFIKSAFEYLRLSKEAKGKQQLKRELRQLDARLDSGNQAFRRAVGSLRVQVHSVLQDLAKLFCEVDAVPFVSTDVRAQAADAPDIRSHLQMHEHHLRISPEYRPLLDAV